MPRCWYSQCQGCLPTPLNAPAYITLCFIRCYPAQFSSLSSPSQRPLQYPLLCSLSPSTIAFSLPSPPPTKQASSHTQSQTELYAKSQISSAHSNNIPPPFLPRRLHHSLLLRGTHTEIKKYTPHQHSLHGAIGFEFLHLLTARFVSFFPFKTPRSIHPSPTISPIVNASFSASL